LQGCREALLAKREKEVVERAYTLYRQGTPGDAQGHWLLAQQQVLREWFTDGAFDVAMEQTENGDSDLKPNSQ
jgi:hypothetical protein